VAAVTDSRQPSGIVDRIDQDILVRLGRNLAAERARRDLTQDDVATRIGMQMQQYSRMERGQHDTGITKYVRAARAIDMPLAELFAGFEE
jgi:transcriptional regulator with XRE-family HTH domain